MACGHEGERERESVVGLPANAFCGLFRPTPVLVRSTPRLHSIRCDVVPLWAWRLCVAPTALANIKECAR